MLNTSSALQFLISAVFGLAILLVLFRFLLQAVQADFYNPLTQFIVKITNPVLKLFSGFIPTLGHINLAALLLAIILETLKILISFVLQGQGLPHIVGVVLWAVGDLAYYTIQIYIYSIILVAILSWFKPAGSNALLEILYRISWPLLKPVKKIIPLIAGIDISPIPVLIILKFISILIIVPFINMAAAMAI